ncbi:MAG: hypothetical protein ACP6IY_21660 [Promethearchaeia archaeon]
MLCKNFKVFKDIIGASNRVSCIITSPNEGSVICGLKDGNIVV